MGDWMIVPSDSDLLHHGRLGQKWGQRNGPPYPLGLSGKQYGKVQRAINAVGNIAEGIRQHKESKKIKKANKKADKLYVKQMKKAAKDAKDREKTVEKKEKAVRHNSYQELFAVKDKLSYQELNDAMSRIDLEQRLYAKAYPKQKSHFEKLVDKVDKTSNLVRKTTTWTKNGMDAWDAFADLYNHQEAVQKDPSKRLRKYKEGGGKKKKNKGDGDDDDD